MATTFKYIPSKVSESLIIQLCLPYKHCSVRTLNAVKDTSFIENAKAPQYSIFVHSIWLACREKFLIPRNRVLDLTLNYSDGNIIICVLSAPKKSLIKRNISVFAYISTAGCRNKSRNIYENTCEFLGIKYVRNEFNACYNEMVAQWKPTITASSRYLAKAPEISEFKTVSEKLVKPPKIAAESAVAYEQDDYSKFVELKCNMTYAAIVREYLAGPVILDDKIYVSPLLDLKKLSGNASIMNYCKRFRQVTVHFTEYLQHISLPYVPVSAASKITAKNIDELEKAIKACVST